MKKSKTIKGIQASKKTSPRGFAGLFQVIINKINKLVRFLIYGLHKVADGLEI